MNKPSKCSASSTPVAPHRNVVYRGRSAYTLVEVICVALLVGWLIALLMPGIGAVKEAGRRHQCSSQLRNLMIALHHYELQQSRLPSGVVDNVGPIRQAPIGYHHNWISAILPYIEERNLSSAIDYSAGVYDPPNLTARKMVIPLLICPSVGTTSSTGSYSSYAGNHHHIAAPINVTNSGVFFLNSRLRQDDIFDGTSNTIYLMEKPIDELDFGWMSGTYATLRSGNGMDRPDDAPSRRSLPGMPDFKLPEDVTLKEGAYPLDIQFQRIKNSGAITIPKLAISTSAGSRHPGGVYFAFGDGRVGFASQNNLGTMQEMCHRQDGHLPITEDQ